VGLYEYLLILRARWQVFVTIVVLLVGAMAVFTFSATAQYTAKTTIYFAAPLRSNNEGDLSKSVLYAQTFVRSYAEAATRPVVLNDVRQQLALPLTNDELAGRLDAQSPLGTTIIQLKATDPSPTRAAAIANAVANRLAAAASELAPTTDQGGAATIQVSTITAAAVPTIPSSPNKKLNLAVTLGWALLIAVVLCLWIDGVDPRVRSRKDVAMITALPMLGYLPRRRGSRQGGSRTLHDSSSRARWGQLRTNFSSLADGYDLRSVLFVAPTAVEPPARLVDHLGMSLQQAGSRVLVIDADLRPSKAAAQRIGLGLSTVLRGECTLAEAVIDRPHMPSVLACGPALPDPGAALGSTQMAELLRAVEEDYDVVLIQTAPLTAATQGLALSENVDGVFVVGDADSMPRDLLERTLSALHRAGGRVRGVVLCA
jgi:capsular polysaccharide biosynthesis protein